MTWEERNKRKKISDFWLGEKGKRGGRGRNSVGIVANGFCGASVQTGGKGGKPNGCVLYGGFLCLKKRKRKKREENRDVYDRCDTKERKRERGGAAASVGTKGGEKKKKRDDPAVK